MKKFHVRIALVAYVWSALCVSGAEMIPSKTVVLTFDDAVKSQLAVVAPLLQQNGFGATFFISHAWMTDREHFMSWADVAKLHEMGFEIGNHTWTHAGFNTPNAAASLAGELALVDSELNRVGVPKPTSFAWPGNAFGPDCLAVLKNAGYQLARRGMQPEAPYGSLELGPLFDPQRYDRMLIPSAGDAYPNWTLDHFKRVVDRATSGQAVVVQFHGVPDMQHPWVNTPEDSFRQYINYLKEGGFHVVAFRDLLRYLPEQPVENDAMASTACPARSDNDFYWPTETEQTLEHLDFWLPNMFLDHHYSIEEMMRVTALPRKALEPRLTRLRLDPGLGRRESNPGVVKVLPYPGGRHPRRGFLEGAIDPLRGTKISLFPPWENGGYIVLDLPEAIFSNLGLIFLAHTHIPTIWNDQNAVIENQDWDVEAGGGLHSQWRLPNGIAFGAHVTPRTDGADLELWLENGTTSKLSGLRTQICAMLKGAPEFEDQSQDGKEFAKPIAVARARDAQRYVLIGFENGGRAWGNAACPCIHSDPVLPDVAPGTRVSVRGKVWFYQGGDVEKEKKRLLDSLGLAARQ